MKTISIGAQDFVFLRENDCFLIDKSDFIKEWWENQDPVTLITRPRRFGKTLNLRMAECFFSNEFAGRSDLFEGLSIWKDATYRDMQGAYPVLFFSFANIKGATYQTARDSILQLLTELYSNRDYLLKQNFLTEQESAYFASVNPNMTDAVAAIAIYRLSLYLSRYYEKKVLIFLDEYDTPLQEAYVNGYWDEMTAFIRSLFNAAFKSNPYMERGLMTGVTRVSKESIFSDLNNLEVVTTTSEKYSTSFGFTEEEVFRALDEFGLSDQKAGVKRWYDGFTFGSQRDVYNPWSITSFLEKKEYRGYWTNTSSGALVNRLVQQGSPQTKIVMEDLLKGEALETELDEEIIFDQLHKKRGAIWSLLLAGGYLKVTSRQFHPRTGRFIYRLELTNREVRMMFEDMVRDWFSDENVPYSAFVQALLCGDTKAMNRYMNQVALETFSFFDAGTKPSRESEPERFYHGFVLGLIVELAGQYRISSNRESGFGRYDVMLEPYKKDCSAFVLEFKVRDPNEEKNLEATLEAALAQIKEKAYDSQLASRGIPAERIRHYGFAFQGKQVLIG